MQLTTDFYHVGSTLDQSADVRTPKTDTAGEDQGISLLPADVI